MRIFAPTPHPRSTGRVSEGRSAKTRRESDVRSAGDFSACATTEPLLTADQERALAELIAAGDLDARDRLVRANLRLVVHIARAYAGLGLDPEDLVGEGYVGLVTAADRFDPRFEVRFATYASFWIKHAMRSGLTNSAAMIRLPAHMVQLMRKWRRAAVKLERTRGQEPSFDEIAEAMSLSPWQRSLIEQALRTRHRSDPSDQPIEVSVPAEDAFSDCERSAQREDLHHRLERLKPTERSVISMRFGLAGEEPLTLKETGRRLGYTREWVRKIEVRALAALS